MSLWHRLIHPVTQYFRSRRGRYMLQCFPEMASARICDLGGSRHFWDKLDLPVPRRNITIFNIDAQETQGLQAHADGDIAVHIYDGHRIPAADGSFDLLVCNSVLEHVPPPHREALAAEMRRVARAVFCQTPAYSFPFEPHFLLPFVHWLPRSLGWQLSKISPWRLLARPAPATLREYWWGTQLLKRGEVARLFPGARIESEKVLGLTKSWYVVSPP